MYIKKYFDLIRITEVKKEGVVLFLNIVCYVADRGNLAALQATIFDLLLVSIAAVSSLCF